MTTARRAAIWAGAIAVLALATGPAAGAEEVPPLDCVLSAPARATPGRPLPLRFALRNRSDHALHVLEWNTPFEGWFGAYVEVSRDGVALPYRGPMLKRGEPTADEYLRFRVGQRRRASVDLAQVFDLSSPGHYRVEPRIRLFDVVDGAGAVTPRPRDAQRSLPLRCNAVEFDLVAAK
jgi:hypothetical protein